MARSPRGIEKHGPTPPARTLTPIGQLFLICCVGCSTKRQSSVVLERPLAQALPRWD